MQDRWQQRQHSRLNGSPYGSSICFQSDNEDGFQESNCNLLNTSPRIINDKHESIEIEKHRNDEDKSEEATALSSECSTVNTIFVSIIIIITMSLFIYSNTQDGAYVQVQVTPSMPDSSSTELLLHTQFG
eukprot:308647_1